MLHLLLFNESLLHYLSIMCVIMMMFSRGFLFYLLHYYGGCQYVKGTKQILIAVCVVECSGLHSNFPVCKLHFHTVNFTVLLCKCFYSFSVFFTKLFWQPQLSELFCKNFFYSALLA